MSATSSENFRLAVLNPGGRDPDQRFDGASKISAREHPPINFHGYAACTRGGFFQDTRAALSSNWPVLLLLRGDFRASERAFVELKKAKRTVAVALKETGAHQIAQQLVNPTRFARFISLVRRADLCLAGTSEAAEFYGRLRKNGVIFVPTPYPIEEEDWNWNVGERSGIFVGTREFEVPSRHHLMALLAAKQLADETGESVTVFNLAGRRGAKMIAQIGFRKVRVHDGRMNYRAYLGEVARHKIVFQLDRSRVPGQVAGDALLCRGVCVGGDGAIERIAFPETCGHHRSDDELIEIGRGLLTNEAQRKQVATHAHKLALTKLSFRHGRELLARAFAGNLS